MDIQFDFRVNVLGKKLKYFMLLLPSPYIPLFYFEGCSSGSSHPKLPAGEIPCCAPEPRRKKLSHFLPTFGWRGRGAAENTGAGEKPPQLPLSSQGKMQFQAHLQLLVLIIFYIFV